ncbi:proteasome assembly chaperone 4-like [Dermacentor andersoni]|uniref:proteasome assembly chaperone 4-like n=1 Tax=Dermacentor andersoni TaxID=34620 RepID=UPI0021555CB2|nr:proteasome assembly chaperone 4-like [Dermacentor andersoni]
MPTTAATSSAAASSASSNSRGFSTHQFSRHFNGNSVHFLVLRMDSSFFLWVGSQSGCLKNLSVAMSTAFEKAPTASCLMGDASDLTSNALAAKLTKRTGCQVFVSYNVPATDAATVNFVHECIVEEMSLKPDKFH